MVARLSRFILLVQLIAALSTGWLIHLSMGIPLFPALTAGLGVIIALRLAITANNFFICYRHRSFASRWRQLHVRQQAGMFLNEFYATMMASSRDMPFRPFRMRIAAQPATLPVLLIHGYGCNSGYWYAMSSALTHAGISHCATDLEPLFCGIDEYVPQVQRMVEALCEETGSPQIILLGHSMGGLVARAYLRACGSEKIAGVITLGTPHHGTVLAAFGAGINSRQMRRWAPGHARYENPWLEQLAAGETADTRGRIVSIYTHHDNIIAPQTSSHLPGARNRALHGIGHVALGSHPVAIRLALREIGRLSRQGATQRSAFARVTTSQSAESAGTDTGR
jgi:pimeloyl-ACP methyl ester carboxylesterase